MIAYTQHILRGAALKKYREVLVACRHPEKELVVDEWNLGKLGRISIEAFCTLAQTYTTGYDGHAHLAMDKSVIFERELWVKLGKFMWKNHQSIYQDHMKYIHNDTVKPFRVKFLPSTKRNINMHNLSKYLTPPSMKGKRIEEANWTFHNQELTVSEIRLAIKDGIPSYMHYELEDY